MKQTLRRRLTQSAFLTFRNSVLTSLLTLGGIFLIHAASTSANTTFIVNSLADFAESNSGDGLCGVSGGICTLRAAIQEANALPGDETITFSPHLAGEITLLTELPPLGSNVTIVGTGAKNLSIKRSTEQTTANFRIFTVASGANVTISGLTMTGGKAEQGGAIYSSGTLTLNECYIKNNNSTGRGGGLYLADGTVNITACTFSGNTAGASGAVAVASRMTAR